MRSFTQLAKSGIKVDEMWPPARHGALMYFIELSSICNAACIFCHYPQMRDGGKPTTIAANEVIEKMLALLKADISSRCLQKFAISLTPTLGDVLVNKLWASVAKQILEIPLLTWFDLVTNGILLNEKNINDLCELPSLDKINFSISIGGVDRDTYKFMFGTDMFQKVKNNVNALFDALIDRKIKLDVALRLRVPDKDCITDEQVIDIFNPHRYQWANYEIMDTFKDVPLEVSGKDQLKHYTELKERNNNPCGMLKVGSMNFHAEGNITACGCHYSQMLNDKSLTLGSVTDSLGKLTTKRMQLIDDWKAHNKIPVPCQLCQHYHQHGALLKQKSLLRGIRDADLEDIFEGSLS